ncbi:hypothetical protein [Persicobacter diffluens]|uniref:Uncharacterized protein n=1 Tax=Persicobacter diffluens TaxID=981 RepID=A0AAN4W3M6_9BACT|nr:hypothetical protein PEDI_50740 [Persicobacter diffluens]
MRSWIIILLTLASFPCFAQQGYNISQWPEDFITRNVDRRNVLEFGQKYYRMWEVNFDYAHRDRMTTFTIPPTTEEGEPTVGREERLSIALKEE